jgi:hypothetical protein
VFHFFNTVISFESIEGASPSKSTRRMRGQDHVGVVAWLSPGGCKQVLGEGAAPSLPELSLNASIHAHVRDACSTSARPCFSAVR